MKRTRGERRPSALRRALLVAALALAATAGERTFGSITDEQQPLYTAVSIVRFGEIGIGRGPLFSQNRPEGDAVSVYGMGQTILDLPAAFLARGWERLFGGGSSQTLFVATELLVVLLAAGLAGLLARELGAGPGGEALAALGAALASPLGAYVKAGYSEPLQAACLAAALLFSVRSARRERSGAGALRAALVSGAAAGLAVLTKPTNLALAPFLLLPLAAGPENRERLRRIGAAAAGAAFPLAAWAAFEVVRFGGLLRAYGGQHFDHPFADGLFRLLVLPNKGLLVYFPLAVLSAAGLAAMARDSRRLAALAAAGASLVLLAVSSAWWAWDGTVGWGPRLLVPLVPILAAAAAVAAPRLPRLAVSLAVVGGFVNLPGLLQSESSAVSLVSCMEPRRLAPEEASRYPEVFIERGSSGEALLARVYLTASDLALSPFRIVPFVLRARLAGETPDGVADRLRDVPWREARPELVPDTTRLLGQTGQMGALTAPFRWPHLLEATLVGESARKEGFVPAYDNALSDQLSRALATGRVERAASLARELWKLQPGGFTAAFVADTLRLTRRPDEARAFLLGLPRPLAGSPHVEIALALLTLPVSERDARSLLRGAALRTHSRNLLSLSEGPVSGWPRDLSGMEAALFPVRLAAPPGAAGGR